MRVFMWDRFCIVSSAPDVRRTVFFYGETFNLGWTQVFSNVALIIVDLSKTSPRTPDSRNRLATAMSLGLLESFV